MWTTVTAAIDRAIKTSRRLTRPAPARQDVPFHGQGRTEL